MDHPLTCSPALNIFCMLVERIP